jgi:hypothetical protein
MKTVYTASQLIALIEKDDNVAISALLSLYDRQTADEQATEATRHQNGQGFNACDAALLTSFAVQVEENRRRRVHGFLPPNYGLLSRRQMDLLRRKLRKYGRQLAEIALEKATTRQAA